MMMHFLDEIDVGLQQKLAVYLRRHQAEDGGWPLFLGGQLDLSCTVKVYYALKLAGDDIAAPHMARARAAILARGGAARANVFTRIALALFGQLPWRAVPYIPVEIMLLAEVVSVPPRQGLVLVTHGDGAAVRPVHEEAAGA